MHSGRHSLLEVRWEIRGEGLTEGEIMMLAECFSSINVLVPHHYRSTRVSQFYDNITAVSETSKGREFGQGDIKMFWTPTGVNRFTTPWLELAERLTAGNWPGAGIQWHGLGIR